MNIKSFLGTLLSLLGIMGLLYTVLLYTNSANTGLNVRSLMIYGALGAVLLFSGVGLAKSVEDDQ